MAAATIPFVGGLLPRANRHDRNSPLWREAVGLMRLINTVECRHQRVTGDYVAPWVLNTVPESHEPIRPRFTHVSFDPANRTIGRFRVFWSTSPDRSGYEVSLVDSDSGFAVFSDTGGEIFYGEARSHADPKSARSLRGQLAFVGSSIGLAPPTFLTTVTEFFAPTLRAGGPTCCSDREHCVCTGSASMCTPSTVPCNVGNGGDCNWCCSTHPSCELCVPNDCTGGGSD